MRAYDAKDYESAARHLREAYEAAPHPVVLYNLALAYDADNRPSAAIAAFEAYLRQNGSELSTERRAAIEHSIGELRTRTGRVRVSAMPESATIELGGSPVPMRADVRVDPGSHSLRVAADGFVPQAMQVEVEAGDVRNNVIVTLQRLPAEPVRPAHLPAVERTDRVQARQTGAPSGRSRDTTSPQAAGASVRNTVWASILAGSGIALGATALVAVLVNQGRHDDWRARETALARDPDALPSTQAENAALGRSIEFWDGAALGLAVGGALLTTAGGALFFTGRPASGSAGGRASLNFEGRW